MNNLKKLYLELVEISFQMGLKPESDYDDVFHENYTFVEVLCDKSNYFPIVHIFRKNLGFFTKKGVVAISDNPSIKEINVKSYTPLPGDRIKIKSDQVISIKLQNTSELYGRGYRWLQIYAYKK